MAKVLFGNGVTDIRGKVRGTVFQRGPYGSIARWKQIPFNRRFSGQQSTRTAMEFVSRSWKDVPDACKLDWDNIAVPPRNGYLEYMSYNLPRVRAGLPITYCPIIVTHIFEEPPFVEEFE